MVFGILVHQTFYLLLFLRMLAKRVVDLKLASENPLLVLWMGFWISRLGLLSRFRTAKGPKSFRKENQGTQQPGGPKPIELWARWLIDPKSGCLQSVCSCVF